MNKVFVYGTLKNNFPNYYLNKGLYLGEYITIEKFSLCLVGERYSPCIIENFINPLNIIGELFEVTNEIMQNFDDRERINKIDGYIKKQILLKNKFNDNNIVSAFCYLKTNLQIQKIEIKVSNLSEYTQEHALLYQQRVIY